ncbi:alpha/beta hydrolase [Kordiimonas sp.]|uniref:alpha/beta hydrolase n=1 Tax=Kordiimonas sp. TaxID=1970157 RepID=UPI003A938176
MKKIAALAIALLSPFVSATAGEARPYEMPRTEVIPIKDSNTGGQYELYIKLPEDYAKDANIKHPVVYTTDGAWHMEVLSGAAEYVLPNAIVVAISWQKESAEDFDGDTRPFLSRFRDYTILPRSNPEQQAKYKAGQAASHLAFIRDDVINYVEANYQTNPAERIYFGFSLGGAFGSYILFDKPDTFKHYVLGSPAFSAETLRFVQGQAAQRQAEEGALDANVYVTVGEKETDAIPRIRAFMTTLERLKGAGLHVHNLEIIERSGHSEAFPATAIGSFKWLSELTAKPETDIRGR